MRVAAMEDQSNIVSFPLPFFPITCPHAELDSQGTWAGGLLGSLLSLPMKELNLISCVYY